MKLRSVFFAFVSVVFTGTAHAVDVVTWPYPCVEHVHRVEPRVDAHVVVVDLTCPGVEVIASRPSERASTVSRFAREARAQIAVNANFFEASPCGLTVGERTVWRDAYYDRCRASVAFGPAPQGGTRARVFDSYERTRINPFPWAWNIVTGWPRMLAEGAVLFEPEEPLGLYRYHPRTLVGVTPGGTHLVLAVIDGRRHPVMGMTALEMIPLLEEFAVSDAINLDGGGSTALFIEREGGIVNHPSDRHERVVASHLGVRVITP
jgi:hypothetical protein